MWTAGVGENSPGMRARALRGLEPFGIVLDEELNAGRSEEPRLISAEDSPVKVLVMPTNEEIEIARQTLDVTGIPANA